MSAHTRLVVRRHVDHMRVNSALCRPCGWSTSAAPLPAHTPGRSTPSGP